MPRRLSVPVNSSVRAMRSAISRSIRIARSPPPCSIAVMSVATHSIQPSSSRLSVIHSQRPLRMSVSKPRNRHFPRRERPPLSQVLTSSDSICVPLPMLAAWLINSRHVGACPACTPNSLRNAALAYFSTSSGSNSAISASPSPSRSSNFRLHVCCSSLFIVRLPCKRNPDTTRPAHPRGRACLQRCRPSLSASTPSSSGRAEKPAFSSRRTTSRGTSRPLVSLLGLPV